MKTLILFLIDIPIIGNFGNLIEFVRSELGISLFMIGGILTGLLGWAHSSLGGDGMKFLKTLIVVMLVLAICVWSYGLFLLFKT